MFGRLLGGRRNLIWSATSEVASRLLLLACLMVLARHLEPTEFGEANLFLAYFALAATLSNFGLDRVALRDLSAGRIAVSGLGTLLSIRLALATVAAAVVIAGGWLARPGALEFWALLGLTLIPVAIGATLISAFHSLDRFGVPAAAAIASALALAGATIAAALLGKGVRFFMWAVVGAEVVRAVWLTATVVAERWRFDRRFNTAYAAQALRSAVPFGVLAILGILYARLDLLMLDMIAGAKAVADYAAAYRIHDGFVLVPSLVLGVLFPRFVRLQISDRMGTARLYLRVTRILVAIGACIAVGVTAFAEPLLSFVFSSTYAASAPVLVWLMVALVFLFWHAANGTVLFAGDNLRPVVFLSLMFVGVNVVANLALIPRYGSVGAAAGTALSHALAVGAFGTMVCRRLGISAVDYAKALTTGFFRTSPARCSHRLDGDNCIGGERLVRRESEPRAVVT